MQDTFNLIDSIFEKETQEEKSSDIWEYFHAHIQVHLDVIKEWKNVSWQEQLQEFDRRLTEITHLLEHVAWRTNQ